MNVLSTWIVFKSRKVPDLLEVQFSSSTTESCERNKKSRQHKTLVMEKFKHLCLSEVCFLVQIQNRTVKLGDARRARKVDRLIGRDCRDSIHRLLTILICQETVSTNLGARIRVGYTPK